MSKAQIKQTPVMAEKLMANSLFNVDEKNVQRKGFLKDKTSENGKTDGKKTATFLFFVKSHRNFMANTPSITRRGPFENQ